MNVKFRVLGAMAGGLCLCGVAMGGPEWQEGLMAMGDAGAFPVDAQVPVGVGALNGIAGELEGGRGTGDFQDMYLIYIKAPNQFSATTAVVAGQGGASFDTQLWLFDMFGTAQLANDETTTGSGHSTLLNTATDGTGFSVTTPGLYLLAITGFDSDPLSVAGLQFDQPIRTEISGPDGSGGSTPIVAWTGPGEFGTYEIRLSGVSFVPSGATGAVFCVGGLFAARRRR
ncbi:MAG: DVUA0089 family protein [Planctomycetota bacterium]|nr:DVUA0089 family protein [Planctomycetota bacterium]